MEWRGIIGPESAKFTPETKAKACAIIAELLRPDDVGLVSGRCPLGGVDVWAEVCADRWGRRKRIFIPSCNTWTAGYAPRNRLIARASDVVHVIAIATYPDSYTYERFPLCYHCVKDEARAFGRDHVKGGACWTARAAMRLGKTAVWHIVHG